jgi:hypothetical protein
MVDFVRRVAVPIVTARKLIDVGTPEHLRMALILLDGATELLLRKNVAEHGFLLASADRLFDEHAKAKAQGTDYPPPLHPITFPIGPSQQELPVTKIPYLSTKQRKKLEREFDPSADMAVLYGTIDQPTSQIFKDAHFYRNIAYHQDTVDSPSLRSTVTIQLLAVGKLLKSVKPAIQRVQNDERSAALRAEIDLPPNVPLTLGGLADFLTRGIEIESRSAADAYCVSIAWRISKVHRALEMIAAYLSPEPGLLSSADTLRLCQLDHPWPDLDECRLTPVAVSPETLDAWTATSLDIARLSEPAEALRQFRAVDAPLRELLNAVQAVGNQVDWEIQLEIDERHGR